MELSELKFKIDEGFKRVDEGFKRVDEGFKGLNSWIRILVGTEICGVYCLVKSSNVYSTDTITRWA